MNQHDSERMAPLKRTFDIQTPEYNMSLLDNATEQDWNKAAATSRQVGGSHYVNFSIQPLEFIVRNELDFCEANAIKYICRHHGKGGASDIDKAIHYLELLKEYKYGE